MWRACNRKRGIELNNFEFLECIANGFSPITGEKFAEGDILLNPEVALRLFKLVRELKKEDETVKTNLKNTFKYTSDINANILIRDKIKSADFASNIYKAIKSAKNVEVLKTQDIHKKMNKFLVEQGILEPISQYRFAVSDIGRDKGFYNEVEPEKSEAARTLVFYSAEAEQFILANLEKIINEY